MGSYIDYQLTALIIYIFYYYYAIGRPLNLPRRANNISIIKTQINSKTVAFFLSRDFLFYFKQYGPQENMTEDKRLPFFITLKEEIVKATVAGKSVIIEMDANSKLGKKIHSW